MPGLLLIRPNSLYTFRNLNRKIYKLGYINIIMLTIDAQLRTWGRSLGLVISKDAIIKENHDDV